MRTIWIALITIAVSSTVTAQQQRTPIHQSGGGTSFSADSNLPVEKIGKDDLVGITVYDAPELTRTTRVDFDGDIRLPMLKHPIYAAGLYPAELETAIAKALVDEDVLVQPVVTVSVVEYRSRPITVAGAVRSPLTFQATGNVTLLDAISQAGGLNENAGSEILVSHAPSNPNDRSVVLTERVSARELLNTENSTSNLKLEGGDSVRVPEAGRVFVAGNVKKPGMFMITDSTESSVLKAIAFSDGLASFSGRSAYIYRTDGSTGGKSQIPINLKKIMARKSPDLPLYANDLLYIPTATGLQASVKTLEISLGVGVGLASILLAASR